MPLIPICPIHIFKYIRQYRFNKREICLSMYVFVSEDHMLAWHLCQICYPLEMKLSEREKERENIQTNQRKKERKKEMRYYFRLKIIRTNTSDV